MGSTDLDEAEEIEECDLLEEVYVYIYIYLTEKKYKEGLTQNGYQCIAI